MALLNALPAQTGNGASNILPLADIEPRLHGHLATGDMGPVLAVDAAIEQAVLHGASDLYFEPRQSGTVLRFRIDGVLQDVARLPQDSHERLVARVKVLAKLASYRRDAPMDGRFEVRVGGVSQDLRVATLPTIEGEQVVLRVIDTARRPLALDALGLRDETVAGLRDLIARPQGCLLLTGPSSSGKTTTIYALLTELLKDARRTHVVTVEDPVEYRLDGVCQSQVQAEAGYDYPAALRAILRQDPDVIVVGEIRDALTARTAIEAGLTGHLVLSTIHSGSAPGVFSRLLDMNIEPYLVASAVMGVLAQRLIRTNCPDCVEIYTPPEALRSRFGVDDEPRAFRRGRGCPACDGLGYRGRSAIAELLSVSDSVAELILARERTRTIRDTAVREGMTTLLQHGLEEVRDGSSTLDELQLAVAPQEA